jgi:hypothetical protein
MNYQLRTKDGVLLNDCSDLDAILEQLAGKTDSELPDFEIFRMIDGHVTGIYTPDELRAMAKRHKLI